MPDSRDIQYSVRSSLPDTVLLGLVAVYEAQDKGYAIMLCSSAKWQQVIGYTLGLANFGHPEILSVGGNEDDVAALVSHVAEQVVEHDQVFSEGVHSTSLISKLHFSESKAKLHELPIARLVLDEVAATWLQCGMPSSFTNIQPRPVHQDLRRVA